jgi:hypothetical protein
MLSAALPSERLPLVVLFTCAALSGLAASGYYNVMRWVKTNHTAADIRCVFILAAVSYGLSSLARPGLPLGERFLPGFQNMPVPFIALYVWNSVYFLKRIFTARELFEFQTGRYQGEKLRQSMLDDGVLISAADRDILKAIKIYTVQVIITGLLILISAVIKIPLSPFVPGSWIFLVLCTLGTGGLLGSFRREYRYAGEGLALSASNRSGGICAMGIFALIITGGAAFSALRENPLPFSILSGLFRWLFGLFSRLFRPVEQGLPPVEPVELIPGLGRIQRPFLGNGEEINPWPFWDWLLYGALGFLVLAFLWFMMKPLFVRSHFSLRGIPKKVRLSFLRWIKALRAGAAFFLSSLKREGSSVKLYKKRTGEIRRLSGELLEGYTPAKKRELRRSVTLFARLVLWGIETCQVSWKPSYAPGEYCARLAAALAVPETEQSAGAILRCGALFEKALYSLKPLSENEGKEFKEIVERITGQGD